MPLISSKNNLENYGCVMLSLNNNLNDLQDLIKNDDLWIDPEDEEQKYSGKITYPHITLLYGICEEIHPVDILRPIFDLSFEDVEFDRFHVFENEEYDCIVIKCRSKSGVLTKANSLLKKELPYYSEYSDYIPHCTLAYVKKGLGNIYLEKLTEIEGQPAYPKDILYADIKNKEHLLPIFN